jgi:Zn-finger nucleic acid-binding protein
MDGAQFEIVIERERERERAGEKDNKTLQHSIQISKRKDVYKMNHQHSKKKKKKKRGKVLIV